MTLVIAFGVGVFLSTFLACRPFEKIWEPTIPGHCSSYLASGLATSIINVVIDFIIITLPIPMIWSLQMARGRKIAISIMFGMGLV